MIHRLTFTLDELPSAAAMERTAMGNLTNDEVSPIKDTCFFFLFPLSREATACKQLENL